jgi:hypothetical protein
VFGGPLVSPQGYNDQWEVFWGGAGPDGLARQCRYLPGGITFSKLGDPSVPFDHLEELFNMVQSNI